MPQELAEVEVLQDKGSAEGLMESYRLLFRLERRRSNVLLQVKDQQEEFRILDEWFRWVA